MPLPAEPSPLPPARTRRLPVWLPKALFESALIVLSVLLALAVDEWREDRARQRRVAESLEGIRAELAENRRLVREAERYHTALADTFAALAGRGVARPDPSVHPQGLLSPAAVLRNAWESAESSGALNDIPYAQVLRLSRVYARQAEYELLTRSLLGSAYDQLARAGLEAFIGRYTHYIALEQDFAGRERQLSELYDRALAALPRSPTTRPAGRR